MDLYCEDKWRIGLLGSMYFVGFVLSGFILLLADVYGRKKMSIVGTFVSLIWVYGLFFTTEIELAYLWLFLTGLTIFRTYSFYMLWMEITQKKHQVYIWSLFLAMKSSISAFIPGFYFLFGGKNFHVPYSFVLIIAPIVLVGSFFIPESPRYYYEKKMYPELRNLISKFAKSNGVRMDKDYLIDKQVEEAKHSDDSPKEMPSKIFYLRQPVILLNLIVVIIWFIAVSFDTYLIGFHLKYIKGNLFFLSIIQTVSDVSATLCSGIMQKLLTTKRTFLISYLMALLFALPLLMRIENNWLIPICIFGSKFGLGVGFNMVYFVNSEIFPTLFVSFAFTIGNIFSRSATILAPEIAELEEPKPMQIFCLLWVVAACSTFFINHTPTEKEKEETNLKPNPQKSHK
jgi:hypothetical protein